MAPFEGRTFGVVLSLTILFILPAYGAPPASRPAAPDSAAKVPVTFSSHDPLVGWYELPQRRVGKVVPGPGTLIPVLKIDGAYYSVCKGVEVPLKECPEGLEWGFQPSSMAGTKIGLDLESGAVYLAIVDTRAQDDWYEPGQRQPMKRIDKPAGLLDAAAPVPKANDDFVGWYQPTWLPYLRYEIRKEGGSYIAAMQMFRQDAWAAADKPAELTPLPDRLGFAMGSGKKASHVTYNKALKRFELETSGPGDLVLRMPLTRIPAPLSPQQDAVPLPKMRIGIPSW